MSRLYLLHADTFLLCQVLYLVSLLLLLAFGLLLEFFLLLFQEVIEQVLGGLLRDVTYFGLIRVEEGEDLIVLGVLGY